MGLNRRGFLKHLGVGATVPLASVVGKNADPEWKLGRITKHRRTFVAVYANDTVPNTDVYRAALPKDIVEHEFVLTEEGSAFGLTFTRHDIWAKTVIRHGFGLTESFRKQEILLVEYKVDEQNVLHLRLRT